MYSRSFVLVLFAFAACASHQEDGFDRSAPPGSGESSDPNVLPPERAPKPILTHEQPNISTFAMEFEAQQFSHISAWSSANEEVRFNASAVAQASRDFDRARRLRAQRAISEEEFLITEHILRHSQHEFEISRLRRDLAETRSELSALRVREAGSDSRTDLRREIAAKLSESYKRTKTLLLEEKAKADDDAAHAAELHNILVRAGGSVSAQEREDGFLKLLAKRKEAMKAGIELKYMDELMAAHALTEQKLR